MGCVPSKPKRLRNAQTIPLDALCRYPRTGEITIKFKNYVGRITNEQIINFNVTEPKHTQSEFLNIGSLKLHSTLCVLPGMDIKHNYRVECQDNAMFLSDDRSLFITLMDGHGKEGEKVVSYCFEIISRLYTQEKELQKVRLTKKDPFAFISLITETCDNELNEAISGFAATYSGAAAVFVYLTEDCIYSGSVGDSRAILGTSKLPSVYPVPQATINDKEILDPVRFRRSSTPDTEIWPLQLTKDQKPSDEEEKKHIISSGGRVQRLVDDFGKKIGPYRVWDKTGNFPGLAMSRSIGDLIAKRLGVRSEPICTSHKISPESDFFLVLASDGLWDVMENEDVVNFVECFRRRCKNQPQDEETSEVTPVSSCISQLLAEEARIRWYSIVAEEDVKIDDITCVVVEINYNQRPKFTVKRTQAKPNGAQVKVKEDQLEYFRAPSIKEVLIGDPKRSSVVGDSSSKLEID